MLVWTLTIQWQWSLLLFNQQWNDQWPNQWRGEWYIVVMKYWHDDINDIGNINIHDKNDNVNEIW